MYDGFPADLVWWKVAVKVILYQFLIKRLGSGSILCCFGVMHWKLCGQIVWSIWFLFPGTLMHGVSCNNIQCHGFIEMITRWLSAVC